MLSECIAELRQFFLNYRGGVMEIDPEGVDGILLALGAFEEDARTLETTVSTLTGLLPNNIVPLQPRRAASVLR